MDISLCPLGPGGLAPTPDEGLLRGFFVDAAAQGRGIGTRALTRLPDVVAQRVAWSSSASICDWHISRPASSPCTISAPRGERPSSTWP
jgi:GNAT superfamily N-acetyltransferase